jgi:hypothetical protein
VSAVPTARVTTVLILLAAFTAVVHAQTAEPVLTVVDAPAPAAADRPTVLMPLYGAMIGLQALDVDSTMKAIRNGAGREANPAMQSAVGSPIALLALKAGATVSIIVVCERLRKQHHGVAATALMIGLNSFYAIVVAHNYTIAR